MYVLEERKKKHVQHIGKPARKHYGLSIGLLTGHIYICSVCCTSRGQQKPPYAGNTVHVLCECTALGKVRTQTLGIVRTRDMTIALTTNNSSVKYKY